MKKLKDAGLVREERRGKWAFYSLNREAAEELLGEAAERLLSGSEKRDVVVAAAEARSASRSLVRFNGPLNKRRRKRIK